MIRAVTIDVECTRAKGIQFSFFQAHPNHILPSLYLMDSMMKNLGGEYLELFSKNIVALFCRSFEKLVCLNFPIEFVRNDVNT